MGTVAILTIGLLAVPAAASASYLHCPPPGPAGTVTCTVEVGSPPYGGGVGYGTGGGGGGAGLQTCHPSSPTTTKCYLNGFGWWDREDDCWYWLEDPPPAAADPAWHGHADGGVYLRRCPYRVDGHIVPGGGLEPPNPIWLPTPPAGYDGPPDPLVAAAAAISELGLVGADIGFAPKRADVGGAGLVGLPTWMWTGDLPRTWNPRSRTAAIPGVSATATARAVRISWAMGDGHTVVCANPGTAFGAGDGGTRSPSCGYVYATPSYDRAGGTYAVTATTLWAVTWQATDGSAGALQVQTRSTVNVKINELEVVVE